MAAFWRKYHKLKCYSVKRPSEEIFGFGLFGVFFGLEVRNVFRGGGVTHLQEKSLSSIFRRSWWTMVDFWQVQAVTACSSSTISLLLCLLNWTWDHVVFCWQVWEWTLVGTQYFLSSAKPLLNPTITFSNSPLDFELHCSEHSTRE